MNEAKEIVALQCILGIGLGVGTSYIHLYLIRRALARVSESRREAAIEIVRGLPVRLGVWVLPLIFVARTGLWACLGLLIGATTFRLLSCWNIHRD